MVQNGCLVLLQDTRLSLQHDVPSSMGCFGLLLAMGSALPAQSLHVAHPIMSCAGQPMHSDLQGSRLKCTKLASVLNGPVSPPLCIDTTTDYPDPLTGAAFCHLQCPCAYF